MDELNPAARRPRSSFGPDRRLTGVLSVGVLIAAGFAVATSDPGGRIIFTLAALLLAGYVATDLLYPVRLRVDGRGLRVHSPFARAELGWDEVDTLRADVRSRYGMRSSTLEIDAGAHLIVLSRRALGADPEQVADQIGAFDPRRR